MEKLSRMTQWFLDWFLDFLLPESQEERALKEISAEDLFQKVAHSEQAKGVFVLFDYRDPLIRDLLLSLKFHHNHSAAAVLAEVLHENLIEKMADWALFSGFSKPLVIPIPLSKRRLSERGYNQSELIARELVRRDGGKTFELSPEALIKTKHVPPQTSLSDKKAREENIRGVFTVKNPGAVAGRNILLLDDIVTTGSTLREAAKTLRTAGAKKIMCIAIAH